MKLITLNITIAVILISCMGEQKTMNQSLLGTWKFENRTDTNGIQVGPNPSIQFSFDSTEFHGFDKGKELVGSWTLQDSILTIRATEKGKDHWKTKAYRIIQLDRIKLVFTKKDKKNKKNFNFSRIE